MARFQSQLPPRSFTYETEDRVYWRVVLDMNDPDEDVDGTATATYMPNRSNSVHLRGQPQVTIHYDRDRARDRTPAYLASAAMYGTRHNQRLEELLTSAQPTPKES